MPILRFFEAGAPAFVGNRSERVKGQTSPGVFLRGKALRRFGLALAGVPIALVAADAHAGAGVAEPEVSWELEGTLDLPEVAVRPHAHATCAQTIEAENRGPTEGGDSVDPAITTPSVPDLFWEVGNVPRLMLGQLSAAASILRSLAAGKVDGYGYDIVMVGKHISFALENAVEWSRE